jgi:hypothetical protein
MKAAAKNMATKVHAIVVMLLPRLGIFRMFLAYHMTQKIFSASMDLYVVVLIMLGALLLYWLYCRNTRVEKVEHFDADTTNKMDDLIKMVKTDIEKGHDKRKWINYDAKALPGNAYVLIQPEEKKKETLKATVEKMGEKEHQHRNLITIKDNAGKLRLKALEKVAHSGVYLGHFDNRQISFRYQKQPQRVLIDFPNEDVKLQALGGNEHPKSLPHPWFYGVPLIFTNGGTPIGLLEFTEDMKKIKPETEKLDVDISVPEDNIKNLPIFLFTYAMLMESLTLKRVHLHSKKPAEPESHKDMTK